MLFVLDAILWFLFNQIKHSTSTNISQENGSEQVFVGNADSLQKEEKLFSDVSTFESTCWNLLAHSTVAVDRLLTDLEQEGGRKCC